MHEYHVHKIRNATLDAYAVHTDDKVPDAGTALVARDPIEFRFFCMRCELEDCVHIAAVRGFRADAGIDDKER